MKILWFSCGAQVIEDPVEIIDNDRELKGFNNMDEVIKLTGYFKSSKSPRRWSRSKVNVTGVPQWRGRRTI